MKLKDNHATSPAKSYFEIINLLRTLGFKYSIDKDSSILVEFSCCSFWKLSLIKKNDFFTIGLHYRTGNKYKDTDIHEVYPLVFSAILNVLGICTIRHLGEASFVSDEEVESMYIFPTQPFHDGIRLDNSEHLKSLLDLILNLYYFHENDHHIFDANPTEGSFTRDNVELESWSKKFTHLLSGENNFSLLRENPNWLFMRSYEDELFICKNKDVCSFLKKLTSTHSDKIKTLKGVSSDIVLNGSFSNTISHERYNLANCILISLGDIEDKVVIAQENHTIVISDEHFICLYGDTTINSFYKEKKLIINRQSQEATLLFLDRQFQWKIDTRKESALFEDLILELLNREPNIISVKKVAPTNQGDNGRDLICDYDMDYNCYARATTKKRVGKMIIQCKTNLSKSKKKSIGVNDVQLADTIYFYEPDGYMLVVNTQITKDLTEKLEKAKSRSNLDCTDWWNSFDIEERLRKHPDIQFRYKSIVDYA